MAPKQQQRCPKGFRWDAKAGKCVPKKGAGRTQGGGTGTGTYEAGGDDAVYIGVPSDYRAVGGGRWKPVKRGAPTWGNRLGRPQGMPRFSDRPIYKEGGEFRQLAGMSPDAIFGLQVRLVGIGMLEEDGWVPGVNDPKTAAAFKKLLAASNTQAREWQDVLPELEENVELAGELGGPGEGEERGPLQVELTNPQDLAAVGSQVAGGPDQDFGTIGRRMNPEEQMRFAESYQGQERMTQTDAYNRGLEAGEFTGPPSPDVAAEEWLKKHRPGEVIATDAAKAAEVWFDLLENSRWRLSSG